MRPSLPDRDWESLGAEEVVAAMLEAFPGRVALACSFQKEETVLLDLLYGVEPKARVFAIDTHHLFPETYAYWRDVERRYGTTIEVFAGPPVEDGLWDAKHELWKANPLADWSDDDCWAYIRERDLPYSKLHDQGYESIGDTHSTQPGKGREGRWAGTERTECGLHT